MPAVVVGTNGKTNSRMIFKLLYKWFPKSYAKVLFLDQRKPQSFEDLSLCFTDSNGVKYYKYNSDYEIPIVRKGHFEKCHEELGYSLKDSELTILVEAMDKALNNKDKKGLMSPDLGMIGFILQEIKNRKENLIHPDILMDMVSCIYIREDEDPAKFDQEIHNQKVEQFYKDSKTGLYDFFYTAGLGEYVPYLKESGGDWERIFSAQKAKLKALAGVLSQYSSERA